MPKKRYSQQTTTSFILSHSIRDDRKLRAITVLPSYELSQRILIESENKTVIEIYKAKYQYIRLETKSRN